MRSRYCFKLLCLWLRVSLYVVVDAEGLAIEDGVGELTNPVAKDEHAALVAQHKVELDVAMAEEEVVDVGMLGQILLGKEYEVFFVLTQIRRITAIAVSHSTMTRPR